MAMMISAKVVGYGPDPETTKALVNIIVSSAAPRSLVPGGLFQSFQNPLNRSGVSFVYRTVEAIERWPR